MYVGIYVYMYVCGFLYVRMYVCMYDMPEQIRVCWNSLVDHIESRVDHIESRVDHIESRVDHIESRVDHIESRVKIESRVQTYEETIKQTQYQDTKT